MSEIVIVRERDLAEEVTSHGETLPTRKKVLVGKGRIPHVTQIARSRSYDGCDTSVDPHVHPTMWEIYYVISGHARFEIGGEVHEASAGSFLAVPPNTLHAYRVAEGEVLELLYFGIATDQ